jgi:hypothetical protein
MYQHNVHVPTVCDKLNALCFLLIILYPCTKTPLMHMETINTVSCLKVTFASGTGCLISNLMMTICLTFC